MWTDKENIISWPTSDKDDNTIEGSRALPHFSDRHFFHFHHYFWTKIKPCKHISNNSKTMEHYFGSNWNKNVLVSCLFFIILGDQNDKVSMQIENLL